MTSKTFRMNDGEREMICKALLYFWKTANTVDSRRVAYLHDKIKPEQTKSWSKSWSAVEKCPV